MASTLSPPLSSTRWVFPRSLSKPSRAKIFSGQIVPSRSLFYPGHHPRVARNSSSGILSATHFGSAGDVELDFGEEDEEGSPWEGALVYKRDSSATHLEYCTTLERLGLGKLSGELSIARTSAMGIRFPSPRVSLPEETPVLISIDVTRKKRKLKLDGILRTVILLGCNRWVQSLGFHPSNSIFIILSCSRRCGGPAAENVFSNFSLLLTEDPIEDEEEEIDLGTIFGSEKFSNLDDDEELIDPDDRLYFPVEEKSIDISKNIRDLIHLEITINPVCDPNCRGLCLKCGTNLNNSKCRCQEEKFNELGPLGSLRQQMRGI